MVAIRALLVGALFSCTGAGLACREPEAPAPTPSAESAPEGVSAVPGPPPTADAESVARDEPLNLVLVVLDTTRPDFLTPYGGPPSATPCVDAFAEEATRFDRAYSSSCWTLPAHATMFTGTLPAIHRATQSTMEVDASLPLLAETLRDHGYATAGFSANPWIANGGLERGFRTFEEFQTPKRGWVGGRVTDEGVERSAAARPISGWLRDQQERDKPFFLFVNLMRAHHPYVPTPAAAREVLGLEATELREAVAEFYPELLDEGRSRSLMNRHYAGDPPLDAGEWERLIGLYRASLRASDDELRRILRLVDKWSDARETLVLIVSDHGENLGEHGHFGHILNLYEPSVRVVFLARGPGFERGATDSTPVHLADVYATLLGAARVAPPAGTVGVDLARERPRDRILSASLEAPSLQLEPFSDDVLASGALDDYRAATCAAIGGRYKLIQRSDGREELYDLTQDPGEERPLEVESLDPELLAKLRASLDEARPGSAGAARAADMDEAALEALRSLGYVK